MNANSTILYVDDDSDDCIFLRSSLEESGTKADLVWAPNGEEAVSYLHSVKHSALPSLIVLDLNMPRWDGRRTLTYLKSQPDFSSIPVVILTTSQNKDEQENCERMGAASYLRKPYHYSEYRGIVANFMQYLKVAN